MHKEAGKESMNKSELIEAVAKKTGLSRREATVGIDTAFAIVSKELKLSLIHI